jgi:hypothetical protein
MADWRRTGKPVLAILLNLSRRAATEDEMLKCLFDFTNRRPMLV